MRKIGEVWLEKDGIGRGWKVQFPNGIMTYKTKKRALEIVAACKFSIFIPVKK